MRASSSVRLRAGDGFACALFLDPGWRELLFLTLGKTQARAAATLGFRGMSG